LSERSERSERSEFGAGATSASTAGQSARSDDRLREAPRPARTRLCRPDLGAHRGRRSSALGRKLNFSGVSFQMRW